MLQSKTPGRGKGAKITSTLRTIYLDATGQINAIVRQRSFS